MVIGVMMTRMGSRRGAGAGASTPTGDGAGASDGGAVMLGTGDHSDSDDAMRSCQGSWQQEKHLE